MCERSLSLRRTKGLLLRSNTLCLSRIFNMLGSDAVKIN